MKLIVRLFYDEKHVFQLNCSPTCFEWLNFQSQPMDTEHNVAVLLVSCLTALHGVFEVACTVLLNSIVKHLCGALEDTTPLITISFVRDHVVVRIAELKPSSSLPPVHFAVQTSRDYMISF